MVEVNSYHANGDLAERHFAVSRREGKPPDWIEGTWHLRLDDGCLVTMQEPKLDRDYPGWRELPEG